MFLSSVLVSDPYVFEPSRSSSESGIYLYGSGFNKQKNEGETLISAVLWFLCDFFSLKNDVNVPSKKNKHKNLEKKNLDF